MTLDPSVQPGAFASRRPISDEEVLELRRRMWADGSISPDEAAQLFDLNAGAEPSDNWTDFFVEALCDYLIARGEPRGYVTDADARWLIDNIDRDGRIESHAELELLVKLFEHAEFLPDALKQFALAEVEQAVLTGNGATRRGGALEAGRISEAEAQVLRRLLFSQGGDGPARISRAEAELLFRLKQASASADNAADWPRLFVQGIANHLMAHQAYTPVDRETAARFAEPEPPRTAAFRDVLAQMGRNPGSIAEGVFGASEADRIAAHDASVARDAAVSGDEREWLQRMMDPTAPRDALEQALLEFLADEGVSLG